MGEDISSREHPPPQQTSTAYTFTNNITTNKHMSDNRLYSICYFNHSICDFNCYNVHCKVNDTQANDSAAFTVARDQILIERF